MISNIFKKYKIITEMRKLKTAEEIICKYTQIRLQELSKNMTLYNIKMK